MKKHIILIRGLTKEGEHWGDVIPNLSELLPDYQVMTLDIPGCGTLHREKSPLTINEMVLRMREDFLSKLNYGEEHECYVVAISLGGMITASWLNSYPADFKKAVLINTSFGHLSPFYQRLNISCLPKMIQAALTTDIEKKEKLSLEIISNDEQKQNERHSEWVRIAKKHPVSLANSARQFWAAWTYNSKIEWDIPTLLLASKKDRMVNVECSKKIHEELNFPIIYHNEAGHGLATDDPRWVADQVHFWIENESAK